MIPGDIGPHPSAPDHYIALGKPSSWKDEDCGTLAVRFVGATGDILFEPAVRLVRSQLPSGEEIYPAYLSEWIPTERELELLAAGRPVRLLISGAGMPPISAWVPEEDEA